MHRSGPPERSDAKSKRPAKLTVRPLRAEELPTLARWLEDPEIAHGLFVEPGAHPGPLEELFAICLPNGRLIGGVRLHSLDVAARQGSFGVFIGQKRLWGQGYGTEASRQAVRHLFERGFARVQIAVLANNDRALASYRRIGFQVVGVVPGAVRRPEGLLNTLILQAGPEEVARAAGATPKVPKPSTKPLKP